MKLFFASLVLEFKRVFFSRWFIILSLIMIIVIAGIFGIYKAEDSALEINIGVVFDSEDQYAQAVFQRLKKLDVASFEHLEGYPQKELERLAAIGKYESIYFLNDKLRGAIASGILWDSVPSLISPTSMMSTLIDEWVFSTILVQSTSDISLTEIQKILKVNREDVEKEILQRIDWYEENHNYVEAVSNWEGGTQITPQNTRLGWVRIYHGVIGVFLIVLYAASLSSFIKRTNYVDAGLRRTQRPIFRIASFVSETIYGLCFGIVGLLAIYFFDKPILRTLHFEIIALLVYVLFLAAVVNILGTILSTSDGVFSGTIFVFLAVIFLGGVLFSPLELSVWLDKIGRVFPTYYYTSAIVEVDFSHLWYLVVGTVVALILGLTLSLIPRGKRR